MDIEVTFTAVNGNQSACIRAREQMENFNYGKIQAMKKAVAEFIPSGQQGQIEVKSSSNALPSSQTSSANPSSNPPDPSKMITSGQLSYLLSLLKKHKISVQSLCKDNGIKRIEDLSLDNAKEISGRLKDL